MGVFTASNTSVGSGGVLMHISLKPLVVIIFTEHGSTKSFIPVTLFIPQETQGLYFTINGRLFITMLFETAHTVYPKKYANGFCFAVLCCGYTLTDFPISIRLTSLALWQSNDCPSASKATLMNMDKYFMWIHYERLHNHNKAKHNKKSKSGLIFLAIFFMYFVGQTEYFKYLNKRLCM